MRALALCVALSSLLFVCVGCSGKSEPETKTSSNRSELTALKITDEKPGTGPAAAKGDTVYVLYTGKLKDGTVFDASEKSGNNPMPVTIGQKSVIEGWEEGLIGAKKGTKRHLDIPAKLGYGERGNPPKIEPNTDLYFDLDIAYVIKKGEEALVDVYDTKPGTGAAVKQGSTVTVKYVGTLLNGEEFDSTELAKKPFVFTIGKKQAVPGFEAGMIGMKVGGKRKIIVPPEVGLPYGNEKIPARSVLTFDVELLSVK